MRDRYPQLQGVKLGDKVTNICAGEGNPTRTGYFVEFRTTSRKNRSGIVHHTTNVRLTDKRGHFWQVRPEVIYPGELPMDECERLFRPIWEQTFGKAAQAEGEA